MKIFKSIIFSLFTVATLSANSNQDSIYIDENYEDAKNLKGEFLNKQSTFYSIALSSIPLSKNGIERFFKRHDVNSFALAHKYGKNKDQIRIIYGLYPSYKEAIKAISTLDKKLQDNKPFVLKMKNFQNFYTRYYPSGLEDEKIVKLKMNNKADKEQKVNPKISDEIKVVKQKQVVKQTIVKEVKKIQKKEIVKPIKKVVKKEPKPKQNIFKKEKIVKKEARKIAPNPNTYAPLKKTPDTLRESQLEGVYFVESAGDFNILSEVFLKDGSSFYTIDMGKIELSKVSVEKFFEDNDLKNNALAYKYGKNKEYARTIYGAYETKDEASSALNKLDVNVSDLKVSNIKNHQKLYKVYHDNVMKIKKIEKKIEPKKPIITYSNEAKKEPKKVLINRSFGNDEVIYVENDGDRNILKEELFNRSSRYYTITLYTNLKKYLDPVEYFQAHGLSKNVLAYSLGTKNDYYRVIYGAFTSSKEAIEAIENLSDELKANRPYVSKVKTNIKKYESYPNKNLDDEFRLSQKIELE